MSAIPIMLGALLILIIAYLTYGSWLARQWGINPSRLTPARELNDGVDYVPTKFPVLLGHHFASIVGAEAIAGPIQAAVFGWVPVLLWILIGGIFFGGMQDFASLFASVRHKGKSLGRVIERNMGKRCKQMFLVFAWVTLLMVVASFIDIVASTFAGFESDGGLIRENAAAASTSVMFIVISILFGISIYRRNSNLLAASAVGVGFIALAIFLGLRFPIYLSKPIWILLILCYIYFASVWPVWILLQPRDYLNSFLLYSMIAAIFLGILFTNPTITLPPLTGFHVDGKPLFPVLFITLACGATSGFHSLVSSGTTAKQLDNERDCKPIGYGAMLIECGLSVFALIAVGTLYTNGQMPDGAPTLVFANAVAGFLYRFGFSPAVARVLMTLSMSSFALTTLDTATRLGRYMVQEFFLAEGQEPESLTGVRRLATSKYFSTLVTVLLGGVLSLGGYRNVWTLYGISNQLLAAFAMIAAFVWLGNQCRNNRMFLIPMAFMMLASLSALVITMVRNIGLIADGTGTLGREGLQVLFAVLLFCLALILALEGLRSLVEHRRSIQD